MSTFFDAVRRQSQARPDHPLLLTPDGPALTHAQALHRSAITAAALHHRGLRPGDRLAAMTAKSPEAVLLYLACLQSGLVYVPVNPDFPAEEAAHIVTDAAPALIVCDPGREPWCAALAPNLDTLALTALAVAAKLNPTPQRPDPSTVIASPLAKQPWPTNEHAALDRQDATAARHNEPTNHAPGSPDARQLPPDDPAVILYTSGTTGRPKGAILTQANILANGTALARHWRFTPSDILLHAVPLFHSHGLFVSLSCTLLTGSTLLLLPRFNADQVVRLLPSCTVFMGVPTMYSRLIPTLTPECTRTIRLFACGSAPLSPADFTAFTAATGQPIIERYGMSETAINCANPPEGPRTPGTVGPPLQGVELRICGTGNNPLAPGSIGAVQVRGPHVFAGYWRRPEQTQAAFAPGRWFDTGDLGSIDPNGALTLAGRTKELIITGGLNVYPPEVERVLLGIQGVAEAAVIGLPHPDYGEAVTAILVPKQGALLTETAIITAVKHRLASYKAPKRVLIQQTLPRNPIGKVQKTQLQQTHATLFTP